MSFNYKLLTNTETNIGEKEKKTRLIVGSVSLFTSLFLASIPLLIIGVILIATGYSRVCPAYSAMERNTCEKNEKTEAKVETKSTSTTAKKSTTTKTKATTKAKTTKKSPAKKAK